MAVIYTGGRGRDRVSIFSFRPIVIDLTAGVARGGGAGRDTLSGLESAVGTNGNDTLIGDVADNRLRGRGGDDQIEGRDGDDWLNGGRGVDSLDGGPGTDTCLNGETVLNCEA